MALHKGFGEVFRAFKLRGGAGGAEHRQAGGAEIVHNPRRQRGFRAHQREGDFFGAAKGNQPRVRQERHIAQLWLDGRARITGRNKNGFHIGRLRQLPGQRVFAAAAADNEQFHVATSS